MESNTEINLEPLAFIHDGLYYTKEFDGMYHAWTSPHHRGLSAYDYKNEIKPVKVIQIPEARKMIREAKFKSHILICTNNVNEQIR